MDLVKCFAVLCGVHLHTHESVYYEDSGRNPGRRLKSIVS